MSKLNDELKITSAQLAGSKQLRAKLQATVSYMDSGVFVERSIRNLSLGNFK
jgi:hypothetical protein